MTRAELEATLAQMRQQEQALVEQAEDTQRQLLMTQGAVQMLEHLLTQETDGAAQAAPDQLQESEASNGES